MNRRGITLQSRGDGKHPVAHFGRVVHGKRGSGNRLPFEGRTGEVLRVGPAGERGYRGEGESEQAEDHHQGERVSLESEQRFQT